VAAEIVFSGGERLRVPSSDANTVMATLTVEGRGEQTRPGEITVRAGFVDFESDRGIVYVRPDQVAYVCDTPG
jgi:hypothetical protein